MIATVKTGPHSSAQGELVTRPDGLCPDCPKIRLMAPLYCRCDYGPRRATVMVGKVPITGILIEREETE